MSAADKPANPFGQKVQETSDNVKNDSVWRYIADKVVIKANEQKNGADIIKQGLGGAAGADADAKLIQAAAEQLKKAEEEEAKVKKAADEKRVEEARLASEKREKEDKALADKIEKELSAREIAQGTDGNGGAQHGHGSGGGDRQQAPSLEELDNSGSSDGADAKAMVSLSIPERGAQSAVTAEAPSNPEANFGVSAGTDKDSLNLRYNGTVRYADMTPEQRESEKAAAKSVAAKLMGQKTSDGTVIGPEEATQVYNRFMSMMGAPKGSVDFKSAEVKLGTPGSPTSGATNVVGLLRPPSTGSLIKTDSTPDYVANKSVAKSLLSDRTSKSGAISGKQAAGFDSLFNGLNKKIEPKPMVKAQALIAKLSESQIKESKLSFSRSALSSIVDPLCTEGVSGMHSKKSTACRAAERGIAFIQNTWSSFEDGEDENAGGMNKVFLGLGAMLSLATAGIWGVAYRKRRRGEDRPEDLEPLV